jgi:hypothetical protein
MPEVSTLAHLEEEVYCEDGENFGFFYPITQESEAAAKAGTDGLQIAHTLNDTSDNTGATTWAPSNAATTTLSPNAKTKSSLYKLYNDTAVDYAAYQAYATANPNATTNTSSTNTSSTNTSSATTTLPTVTLKSGLQVNPNTLPGASQILRDDYCANHIPLAAVGAKERTSAVKQKIKNREENYAA